LPDRDGKLIQFCKEVHAPEVVGQLIGKTLLRTLGSPEKKIVLLNDTVATLLAGKSRSHGRKYDSFIGYILGTGTNTCYIENNCNILKNRSLDQRRSQIINIESGNFRKAPLTDIDLLFDKTTTDPGSYTFEKMFSGGYFGGLCLFVIKVAATEGIFSDRTAGMIAGINDLSSNEANEFLLNPESQENILSRCFYGNNEGEICRYIIETIIDRAAKLVASNLAAVVLKTGKGKYPELPVLITVEGTTFYKLCDLRPRIESYFYEFLSGERKRFVEFTEVAQSGLVGAGLAALIE
jgi:hexokinase